MGPSRLSRRMLPSNSYKPLVIVLICIVILETPYFHLGLDTYSVQGMTLLARSRVGSKRVCLRDYYLEKLYASIYMRLSGRETE